MVRQLYRKFILLKIGVFFFLLVVCAQLNGESLEDGKMLEGRILYESSKQPLVDIEVSLFKLKKPLFSMRGWEKIATVKTGKDGSFFFKINEAGPYEVRWNPEADIVPHEFPVEDFEGKKTVEILHKDKEKKVYPWSKKKP
ncbi:hypothetical protein Misp06_00262 [Microbulbifer sp. NBRC 101763]|uniref:hypothetical protein n=1 Tax=Microbulbifer sp. NBRC 101763 TaxID=1113820 RepID=UPI0030A5583F